MLILGLVVPGLAFADVINWHITHFGSFDDWQGDDGSHGTGQWIGNLYDFHGTDAYGNPIHGTGMMVGNHFDMQIEND